MIKALFLDMDETLCDTSGADVVAGQAFIEYLKAELPQVDAEAMVPAFFQGIYKNLDERLKKCLLPIVDEGQFRLDLLKILLKDFGLKEDLSNEDLLKIKEDFNCVRMKSFDFYPGVKDLLAQLRQRYELVVITNGPVYSQHPKLDRVRMKDHVDHIIVGGEEPEEKPALSIFQKALGLVNLKPEEVIHVGDSLHSDIGGARLSGIRNVWICGTQEQERQFEHTPDYIIHKFSEIEKVLQQF